MALPKLNTPLFELAVPSSGKKVKYKPFTVKEEKILLIAQESKSVDQIILAIKQIINNCVFDLNVEDVTTFDLEYIMLHLRSKSVSNIINFTITDPDTKEEIELEIDVNEISVYFDPDHNNKIQLDDSTVLIMKYPRVDQLKQISEASQEKNTEKTFNLMIECFDYIVSGEEIYKLNEFSKKEIDEFVDSMSSKNLQDVKKFFDMMPSLSYEKQYTTKDGKQKTFKIKGTETFFI
jgi:hypothetical protein